MRALGVLSQAYEVVCVCKQGSPFSLELTRAGYRVVSVARLWAAHGPAALLNPFRVLRSFLRVVRYLPVAVYTNTGPGHKHGVRLARLLRVPSIVHVHTLLAPCRRDRFLLSRADAVLVNSAATQRTLPTGVGSRIVHNSIPAMTKGVPVLKQEFGVEQCLAVTHVGTLTEQKGWEEFIHAAVVIRRDVPDVVFFAVGEAKPEEKAYEALLRAEVRRCGLSNVFFFTGFRREMQDVYASADVLLFPTRVEGFGLVIVEAFVAGVAVVSTRSGGPEDVIEDGVSGFLCEVGDVPAMASCVTMLLTDVAVRRRVVNAARARARVMFGEDVYAEALRAVFATVIGPRGPRSSGDRNSLATE